jgi:hypothetical protein
MKRITLILLLTLALPGCARFSTHQTDSRAADGTTIVTTRATAYTLFTAKSQLANWKAEQSESTQGAEVGSLVQEASGTNIVNVLKAIAEIVKHLQ